jgi:hypothetical protein
MEFLITTCITQNITTTGYVSEHTKLNKTKCEIPCLESHTSHGLSGRDLSRSHGIKINVCIHTPHNIKKKLKRGNCGGLVLHILIFNIIIL